MDAVAIAQAGLKAADASEAVRAHLATPPCRERLAAANRVLTVSVGKAAGAMAVPLDAAVDRRKLIGTVAVGLNPSTWDGPFVAADHPLPGFGSVAAADTVESLLRSSSLREGDLVILALSGGSSAMLGKPRPPLSLEDLSALAEHLLRSGLDVTTVNAVRQRVSVFGAGGFAARAWPAATWCLGVVDNVQVGMPAVGSGPTSAPLATVEEVVAIVDQTLPDESLRDRILAAVARPWPVQLDRATNDVVVEPGTALRGAEREAARRGYTTVSLGSRVQGEARRVAGELGELFRDHARRRSPLCVLAAGEVTVDLGNAIGRGGRCQEMSWAMIPEIAGTTDAQFAAVATDGCDYELDAGGAAVTNRSWDCVRAVKADWRRALEEHDTHDPLKAIGALLPSTPPGTNVCDLYVFTTRGR